MMVATEMTGNNSSRGTKQPVRQVCQYKNCGRQMWCFSHAKCFYIPRGRASLWLDLIGREDLKSLPWSKLRGKIVCENHFLPTDFSNCLHEKLNWNALPIKYVPSPIQSDKPDTPNQVKETLSPVPSTCGNEGSSNPDYLPSEPILSEPPPKKEQDSLYPTESYQDKNERCEKVVEVEDAANTCIGTQQIKDISIKRLGLYNLGNTCYINAAIQALFEATILINSLTTHRNCCVLDECFACDLLKLYEEMQFCADSDLHLKPACLPDCLIRRRSKLGGTNPLSFKVGIQHDASELLSAIQDELLEADKHTAEKFTGSIKSIFTCSHCNVTYSKDADSMAFMTLPVVDKCGNALSKLEECLNQLVQIDEIQGKECSQCGEKTKAYQRQVITKMPDVLVIQLARFLYTYENGHLVTRKLKHQVDCPEDLVCSGESYPQRIYKLVSTVNHKGNTISNGHYTCTSFTNKGNFLYDDAKVTAYKSRVPPKKESYILIYKVVEHEQENCAVADPYHASPAFKSTAELPDLSRSHIEGKNNVGEPLDVARKLIFEEEGDGSDDDLCRKELTNTSSNDEAPTVQNVIKFVSLAEDILKSKKNKSSKDVLRELNITKKELTPIALRFYGTVQSLYKELARVKNKYRANMKEVPKSYKDLKLLALKTLKEIVSPELYQIIKCQVENDKRPPKGTRFTLENKIFALSMFKTSPKGYELLQMVMKLPSRQTLNKLLNKIPFTTGVSPHSIACIKSLTKDFIRVYLFSVMSWDETKIIEKLLYNSLLDQIDGFEDYGHLGRTSRLANQALLFAFRGLKKKYKQPFAPYFSRGGTPTEILAQLIIYNIEKAYEAGIVVVICVCDQASTNIAALRSLGASETYPVISVGKSVVVVILDPPHEIKCFRSLLMHHPLQQGQEIALYEHIIKYYTYIEGDHPRLSPKLTINHIIPIGKFLMRVFLATQLLSYTTAAGMLANINFRITMQNLNVPRDEIEKLGLLDKDALPTIKCILNIDKLFDSFNGSAKKSDKMGKIYRTSVSQNSPHFELWEELLPWLNSLRFLTSTGKTVTTPTITSMIWTINGFKFLWHLLKNEGVTDFNTRDCQQDFLENLFGLVKQNQGDGHDPTVPGFMSALKTIIINRCLKNKTPKKKGQNCEEDSTEILADLRSFLLVDTPSGLHNKKTTETNDVDNESDHSDCEIETEDEEVEKTPEHFEISCSETQAASLMNQALAHVAGYTVKAMLSRVKCELCKDSLITTELQTIHYYIKLKDFGYPDDKKLHYCTEKYILTFGALLSFVEELIEDLPQRQQLKKYLMLESTKSFGTRLNFVGCSNHGEKYREVLIEFVCRIAILWYCKRKNDSLKEKKSRTLQMIKDGTGSGSANPRIAELQQLLADGQKRNEARRKSSMKLQDLC